MVKEYRSHSPQNQNNRNIKGNFIWGRSNTEKCYWRNLKNSTVISMAVLLATLYCLTFLRTLRKLQLQGSLKIVPIYCAETSVRNYQSTTRKIVKEGRSHSHPGGSLIHERFPKRLNCFEMPLTSVSKDILSVKRRLSDLVTSLHFWHNYYLIFNISFSPGRPGPNPTEVVLDVW